MTDDPESDEAGEILEGAAARARLYRARADALEAQLATTDLPRLHEKLAAAATRFRELALSEDVLVARKKRQGLEGRAQRDATEPDDAETSELV